MAIVEDFLTPDNGSQQISSIFSVVIDAIDQVRAKTALIAYCKRQGIPVIVGGAAGGQLDPTTHHQL